jgi:hypothetical protein
MKKIKEARIVLGSLVAAAAILVGLQLCLYNADHNPIGHWRSNRMVRQEIELLRTGTDPQRILAAQRLGPWGMNRDDARKALRAALNDSNQTVVANAKLSLRFFLNEESIKVDRETYRLAAGY